MEHSFSAERWIQITPAGFPPGISGIGDDIDGAVQQAPHFLQFMYIFYMEV
jgi:hypothetical protein